ncbi:MAG: galactitol-1-phosphate 5-dehydrogenase [Thermoguttaceae bacterium]|jgi:L-iditol 2-dehydrogenase
MKALVLTRYDHFQLEDWPLPAIGPGEVLLQVAACGICGSDVHGMDGSTGRRRPPIVMGHEAAGVVAQLGPEVSGWSVGDRVTFDSTVFCGDCWFCRRGEINLCDRRRVLGVSCDEYRCHGAFAEYLAVPQRILHRLPDGLSFEHAALVEPLSVALHAVGRAPPGDETVVVVGSGLIGLLVIQALRAGGYGPIIAVDLDQRRLDLARRLGADDALRADADVPAEIIRRTAGRGAALAIEAVGIAASVATAVACLRKGGHLTLVGNLAPSVPLPLQAVVTRQLTLAGSCGSCGEYPAGLELLARGAVQAEPLISAVAPLADGPLWFDRLRQPTEGLLKVILKP